MLGNGIVDPVARKDAEGEEELKHAAQLTADRLGCHLGAEHGDDDCRDAHAEARDDASGVPRRDRVVWVEELKNRANVEDARG